VKERSNIIIYGQDAGVPAFLPLFNLIISRRVKFTGMCHLQAEKLHALSVGVGHHFTAGRDTLGTRLTKRSV
jgi:hypothetical protein